MPLDTQVKLLRAIQEGEVDPVGARRPIRTDFRLISATNRTLVELVREQRFREDLYYRISVFPIMIPPLRDRIEDVPDLAKHFVARIAAEEGKRIDGISAEAMRLLASFRWPGNVRQLENIIFRAVVLADGPILDVAEFPQIAAQVLGFEESFKAAMEPAIEVRSAPPAAAPAHPAPMAYEPIAQPAKVVPLMGRQGMVAIVDAEGELRTLEDVERDVLRYAIAHYRGNMTESRAASASAARRCIAGSRNSASTRAHPPRRSEAQGGNGRAATPCLPFPGGAGVLRARP